MKKKLKLLCFSRGSLTKIYLKIKLLAFLMFLVLSVSAADSYSQSVTFNLKLKNVAVKEVFDLIEKESEFILLYNEKWVDIDRHVDIKVKNGTVEDVLKQAFKGTRNEFRISDRQIVIVKGEKAEIPVDIQHQIVKVQTQQPRQKEITGRVTDEAGLPLPGTTIIVKGTTVGTVTNADGEFLLNIPLNAETLQFSFVGMRTQEVMVGSQTRIDVTMMEETIGIEEVVAVGYGVQKKESVVGSIAQIDNEQLMRSRTSDITNALSGKLSGVLTIQKTGQPGLTEAEIIIRGVSSWSGSSPLVLIDGVERDFTDLDPNEVENISVLKDASATAVFGAKGANGVIIVTTKRGTLHEPKFDASFFYGGQMPIRSPKIIDSYTTMQMKNVAHMNDYQFTDLSSDYVLEQYKNPSSPLNALQFPNVDWHNLLVKSAAPTLNANLNVTGGTDFVKYFCALGYSSEGGLFNAKKIGRHYDMNYSYKRFNYRTNIDFNLTNLTVLRFNLGGSTGITQGRPTGGEYGNTWRNFYNIEPGRFPAYFPEWVLEEIPDPDYPDASGKRLSQPHDPKNQNPYSMFNSGSFNRDNDSKLFTDLILEQKLDFITKGLLFKGKVSVSTYYGNNILRGSLTIPEYLMIWENIGTDENPWHRSGQGNEVYTPPPLNISIGGMLGEYYRNMYYESSLSYNKSIGKHNITALALLNAEKKIFQTDFPYYNAAVVGRVTYNYLNKYLAEVNIGYTGSERFAPGNRFGFFPAGAVGWVVSEEKIFKNALPWVNFFKLRYSQGIVGSDKASNRWLYISEYYTDSKGNIYEDKAANHLAQWEEAEKKDIGIELRLLNNQLSINVDLFDEKRYKMLLAPRTTTMFIGNDFKELNMGKVKKHGMEIEIDYKRRVNNDFLYSVGTNIGLNENRVVFRDDPVLTPDYQKDAGKPLHFRGGTVLTGSGYHTSVDDIHINPSPLNLTSVNVGDFKFLDYNADGKINRTGDVYPIKGLQYPPVVFSIFSGVSWKKWNLNVMFYGNYGKYSDVGGIYLSEFIEGNWSVHKAHTDYWRPDNPDALHSTLHYVASGDIEMLGWGGGMIHDKRYVNTDYLRLKEVYIGYSMSSNQLANLAGISNLHLYVTGTNLWTLTQMLEGDPERRSFDYGYYPLLATFKAGVKFDF